MCGGTGLKHVLRAATRRDHIPGPDKKVHSIINYYSHALRGLARSFSVPKQVYRFLPSISMTLRHFHDFENNF